MVHARCICGKYVFLETIQYYRINWQLLKSTLAQSEITFYYIFHKQQSHFSNQLSCFYRTKVFDPLGVEWRLLLLDPNKTFPLRGLRELFTTPPVLTTSLLYFAMARGWFGRITWIIPWGLERVGRTKQGTKNQCFCACYRTSADCTQPPLPVSLPGNQRLHLNTVDLHMHMLSI